MAKKFVFDFNRITYKELMAMDVGDEDAEDQNNREMLELVAQVLIEWPYDDDISVEGIENLGLIDYAELQGAFNEELDSIFQKVRRTQ